MEASCNHPRQSFAPSQSPLAHSFTQLVAFILGYDSVFLIM
jgi:hypothetical protein